MSGSRILGSAATLFLGLLGFGFVSDLTLRSAEAAVFNPTTFTLSNGLQVVVIENHRAPVITNMVWYKVGAADESPGETGLAHFLEHLMFKGTPTIKPQEFSKIIARNGGQDNAFTTQDYTAYHEQVASDRLELVLKMEADRMQNLRLSDAVVLPEREVVREERRSRIDNNPDALLDEEMDATEYMNLPYHRPVIGWDHEITELGTKKAIAFYHRHYAPNNAILIVAGDVTAEQLRPLAEKYFGPIPKRDVAPRKRTEEPPHHAAKRVTLRDPRVSEPEWVRDYLAPTYTAGETQQVYALQLLAQILGGDSSSRLYQSLAVEQKLAAGVDVDYESEHVDLSEFTIEASPQPGIRLEKLEAAIDAELAKILEKGVTEDELTRAKRQLIAAATYARDSMGTAARLFGVALAAGGTIDQVESWPDKIAAVTPKDVDAAAAAVLKPANSTTGELLPAAPQTAAAAP
ncbi:MAG: pitrilysin family protein [Alphaproteobacteria bacterium]